MTPVRAARRHTAAQAVIAQAKTWSPDDRLADIEIDAKGYHGEISAAVVAAELSMTTDQVTQLTLTVEDPGFEMVKAGVFEKRSKVTYGGRPKPPKPGDVDYVTAVGDARSAAATGTKPRLPLAKPLVLELGTVSLGPGDTGRGGVVAEYRPKSIQKLRRTHDVVAVNGVDPSEVVFLMCLKAGAEVKVKRAAKRLQVYTSKGESHWHAIKRWAEELGYLVFECAGTIYFGPPTWLVEHLPRLRVGWANELADRTDGLIAMPECSRSENAKPPVTVSFQAVPTLGERIRPGMALDLSGIPTFKGRYLVLSVTGNLGAVDPWQIEAATPIDPEPAPSDDKRSATAAQVTAAMAYFRALALAQAAALAAAGGSGGAPGGPYPGHLRGGALVGIALAGVPMSWLGPLMRRAMQESSGNPHAINNWDSNAAAGHPSMGLMQTIRSTFEAHKLPGHNDIWNPVDNMCAAIRYIIGRYGSVVNLPSGGY